MHVPTKNSRSDQYPGAGVFKSTDGGANWTQAGEIFSGSIVKIQIPPPPTSEELLRADVNGDGIVDLADVVGIMIIVIIDIILGGKQ